MEVIWWIGILFTIGYSGLLKSKESTLWMVGVLLLTAFLWPLFLGMLLSCEPPEDTANARPVRPAPAGTHEAVVGRSEDA